MIEKLNNILLLAYTLAREEIEFTETEKRVFKEFMQALDMDPASIKPLEDKQEKDAAIENLATKEEKTVLLDILLLLVLSQGDLDTEKRLFMAKCMRKIRLQSSDYTVFPLNTSFDEFVKRTDINQDNLYRMLWTKVSHIMRKKIFLPQWSPSMTCGIKAIDKQHRTLIDHFASYVIKLQLDHSSGEVKKMFSFLQGYANEHFKTEETLLIQNKYPALEEHQAAHEEFRKLFAGLLQAFKKDKNLDTLQEGLPSILQWFLNHIRTVDIPACFYLKIKQASTIRKNQVLIYHDDEGTASELEQILSELGIDRIVLSENEKESWDWVQTGDIALVVILNSGNLFKGIDLLQRIRKNNNNTPVLLMPTELNQNDLTVSVKRYKLNHPLNQLLPTPYETVDLIRRLQIGLFGAKTQ